MPSSFPSHRFALSLATSSSVKLISPRIITSAVEWMRLSGTIVSEKTIILAKCRDDSRLYPYNFYHSDISPRFQAAEMLIVKDCSRLFSYYQITRRNFPAIKTLIFLSNPGKNAEIFSRFLEPAKSMNRMQIYVSNKYETNSLEISSDICRVHFVPHDSILEDEFGDWHQTGQLQ